MSTKSHGGPREGAGRKSNLKKGLPKVTWQDYERIPFPKPKNDREADAVKWFKGLEPFERLQLLIRFYRFSP